MACSPLLPWGQPLGWPLRSRVRAGRKWRTIGENKAGGPSLAVPAVLLGTSLCIPLSGLSWQPWLLTLPLEGLVPEGLAAIWCP